MNCFPGSERLYSKIFYLQRIGLDFKAIPNCLKTNRNDFLRNAKAATSLRTTWTLIQIFIQFFNPWN